MDLKKAFLYIKSRPFILPTQDAFYYEGSWSVIYYEKSSLSLSKRMSFKHALNYSKVFPSLGLVKVKGFLTGFTLFFPFRLGFISFN